MIMTLVAMLSMTTVAFAEDENTNAVNNVEAYNMTVNMEKLSEALMLTVSQREAVENIHSVFTTEMTYAAQYGKNDREAMVKRAIDTDVKRMRSVLNAEQMHIIFLLGCGGHSRRVIPAHSRCRSVDTETVAQNEQIDFLRALPFRGISLQSEIRKRRNLHPVHCFDTLCADILPCDGKEKHSAQHPHDIKNSAHNFHGNRRAD